MTTTATTTAAAVRDRPVGRPALLRPPGDGRRAEPDRRHEQPAISRSPSTTATSRPATARRLDHADHLQRRALRAGARRTSTRSKAPAMFTPGDNDWTDCDRPVERRLQLARAARPRARRSSSARRSRSASTGCARRCRPTPLCLGVSGPAPCVENRRWTVGGVTYATLNVQGSCNNLCDTAPDPAEYAARNDANIAWLQQTLRARRRRAARPRS